jgi:hypothetical protein
MQTKKFNLPFSSFSKPLLVIAVVTSTIAWAACGGGSSEKKTNADTVTSTDKAKLSPDSADAAQPNAMPEDTSRTVKNPGKK